MNSTVYEAHARHLVDRFGLDEARRIAARDRNNNAPGTFSHGFHTAVLKIIERMQREAA